jgi:hypothetical protein
LQQARRHPHQLAPDPPADHLGDYVVAHEVAHLLRNEPRQALLGDRRQFHLPGVEERRASNSKQRTTSLPIL